MIQLGGHAFLLDLAEVSHGTTITRRGSATPRWQALQAEIDDLDAQLTPLVTAATPELLALPGVGVETAGQLLVTAGDSPRGSTKRRGPRAVWCPPVRHGRPRVNDLGTGHAFAQQRQHRLVKEFVQGFLVLGGDKAGNDPH